LDDLKRELADEEGTGPESSEERSEGAGRGAGSRADAEAGDTDGPDAGRDTSESEASDGTSGTGTSQGQSSGTYESRTGRMTFHLPRGLMERLRNAVYWTPAGVTLSSLAREALTAAVERIEEKYNDGEPFPPRDDELTGGRPPGT